MEFSSRAFSFLRFLAGSERNSRKKLFFSSLKSCCRKNSQSPATSCDRILTDLEAGFMEREE